MPHAAICWCNLGLMVVHRRQTCFNAARGNLLVQSRHALPTPHMGRDGVLESHAFFRHTLLTQEEHTLQSHDVNPCFPFCDAVYTILESANDRIQLCRSIAALSIFPAP